MTASTVLMYSITCYYNVYSTVHVYTVLYTLQIQMRYRHKRDRALGVSILG